MLTKNIKYTDYNGVEREEPFLFNLSKAELMEMQLGTFRYNDKKYYSSTRYTINSQNI